MTKVTIYTTSICPCCHAAKRLLHSEGIAFHEVPLDGERKLRRRLARTHAGWRTVPMVFIGERFVGGLSELRELHTRGGLRPLLEVG
ncbi:MAG: glutaredoxin [Acidobacteria bacterium]|nr:glutaredoxin [Acidobacteriota bacterium]